MYTWIYIYRYLSINIYIPARCLETVALRKPGIALEPAVSGYIYIYIVYKKYIHIYIYISTCIHGYISTDIYL